MKTHLIKIALLAIGIALLVTTFYTIDITHLFSLFRRLKSNFFLILCLYPIFYIVDVLGWLILFPTHIRSRIGFFKLYLIRLAGDALNFMTPFADIGGEYIKVKYCSDAFDMPKRSAFVIIFIERTALFISELAFWFVGLLPLCLFLPLGRNIKLTLILTTTIFAGLIALFVTVQKRGFFTFIMSLIKRFKKESELMNAWHTSSQEIDQELQLFYASKDKRWPFSLFLHFLSWVLGGVEMFVIMRFLGVEATLMNAMILESLLQLIRTSSFFIPGHIGVQEGALALVMHSLGFDASIGVAISLIKRFRQIVFVGAGLVTIQYMNKIINPKKLSLQA